MAVDLQGKRESQPEEEKVALALRAPSGKFLTTQEGRLPVTTRRNGETKHDAAVRGAREALGLSWGWVQERARRMPVVCEREGITLFGYDLVLPLQELSQPSWGGRAVEQRATSVGDASGKLLSEVEERIRSEKGASLWGSKL